MSMQISIARSMASKSASVARTFGSRSGAVLALLALRRSEPRLVGRTIPAQSVQALEGPSSPGA